MTASCQCEFLSDRLRIQCLVEHFSHFMAVRGLNISKQHKDDILATEQLIDVKLLQSEVNSITEELAENQILYTFVSNYSKNHPRFQQNGPSLGDLKLKTNFFQST